MSGADREDNRSGLIENSVLSCPTINRTGLVVVNLTEALDDMAYQLSEALTDPVGRALCLAALVNFGVLAGPGKVTSRIVSRDP